MDTAFDAVFKKNERVPSGPAGMPEVDVANMYRRSVAQCCLHLHAWDFVWFSISHSQ